MKSEYSEKLLSFIEQSPTCFHVCENMAAQATEKGYAELYEGDSWNIVPGGKYFVRRNGSSILLFRIPEQPVTGYMICASHSDSPSYKIKDNMELDRAGLYAGVNTEGYGGMIPNTWLDRPLSCAGRLLVRNGDRIVSVLTNADYNLMMIPNIAPHMMRVHDLNPAVDLVPIYAEKTEGNSLLSIMAEAAHVKEEDILAHDLYLYLREKGIVWGAHGEFIASPKLDDLQCAYSSFVALMETETVGSSIPMCCVFDNEEVGSQSKQGAASTFLPDTMARIAECLGLTAGQQLRSVSASLMVSADNAHAVHPNHPECADPTHRPKMNGGIVVKRNSSQKYTTDAISSALFEQICAHAEVPVQRFFNRSDMGGGSTLGNIANTQVSLNTVDIGLPQLAMHSSYESAGIMDTDYLVQALEVLFTSHIETSKDSYILRYGK